jgi:hypothetical protein
MHATAMDLEGRVLPVAAYRHWVLAFPMQVRFHLARDEELLGKLRQIFVRAVNTWLRAKARKMGVARPLTGAVAFTQRFSSRLMLYPHVHCVIPDGVFAQGEDGKLVFHELRPKDEDVAKIAKRIAKRSHRLLATLEEIDPDALDQVRGQAIQGELALKIVPVEAVEEVKGRLLANVEGFSLQAQRRLHQSDRRGLEFLLRYVLRPPFALERMRQLPSGKIELGLKRPLGNGLATIELTPMALLRRLASIVPPPGNRDTSYFGVFAAHSKWRRQLVRPRRKDPEDCQTHPGLFEARWASRGCDAGEQRPGERGVGRAVHPVGEAPQARVRDRRAAMRMRRSDGGEAVRDRRGEDPAEPRAARAVGGTTQGRERA